MKQQKNKQPPTFPTGAWGMHACAASARASPALRTETTHTLLSLTKTLENVAAVGVVMNCRLDSRHAIPYKSTDKSKAGTGISQEFVWRRHYCRGT